MRKMSVSALAVASLAVAGCSGAETAGGLTGTGIAGMELLCSLECLPTPVTGTPTTGGPPIDTEGGVGQAPGGGAAGGNTTNLTTGDTTIAIEKAKLTLTKAGTPSLSSLSATNTEIFAATKPTQMTFRIDTNTNSNGNWPVPVPMDEYPTGTNRTEYWDSGNKAGATYREYRVISGRDGNERDESLQLWVWGNSYATQYRNSIAGEEAVQQAWSFGGNKTASTAMPTGGSATYNGRWVGTAKAANFAKVDGQPINPNVLWRVQGNASINANFGTGAVTGLLRPETWTSYQETLQATFTQNVGGGFWLNNDTAARAQTTVLYAGTTVLGSPHYYTDIYDTQVQITAKMGTGTANNTYTGTAKFNNGYITGDNPVHGAFFGTTAVETTGVFTGFGTLPYPVGGAAGINGDRRGYLTINGAFHGTCGAACP